MRLVVTLTVAEELLLGKLDDTAREIARGRGRGSCDSSVAAFSRPSLHLDGDDAPKGVVHLCNDDAADLWGHHNCGSRGSCGSGGGGGE